MGTDGERIPVASATFTEDDARAAYDVVRSGWVTMGKKVAEFEAAFADAVGARHAVAMCNGTATLHAILAALGIGPGDEVILPTLTYVATANAVLYQGATPVLCECDPITYNTTAGLIEPKLTARTRAIMTVDMNGLPIDYEPIVALGRQRGIPVIGDSAESLGAVYRGEPVGAQAAAHSFSFFGNKNVTTGEGGMVTTNDARLAEKLRILRNQGQEGRYHHTVLGFNYRMTDLAAAVGVVQLSRLKEVLDAKAAVAARYDRLLAPSSLVRPPMVPAYVDRHAWYMYAVSLDPTVDRDAVVRGLEAEGIETRLSFPPVHVQPYYRARYGFTPDSFPVSQLAWSQLIDLPIWPGLGPSQIERVAAATLRLCQEHRRP